MVRDAELDRTVRSERALRVRGVEVVEGIARTVCVSPAAARRIS
jgi:hypothetical protein